MNYAGVTCTRCKKDVVFPNDGEMWCECGFTYVRRDKATGDLAWGGPGDPRPFESERDKKPFVPLESPYAGINRGVSRVRYADKPMRTTLADLVRVRKRKP